MENKEIVIKPSSGLFEIDLQELWEYRDLIKVFISKNFKTVYKQTILGPLWLVINPILTSIIFTFVFGNFAGISTDGVPKFLFYITGSTIWALFKNATMYTSNTFVTNRHIFTKIYFPRLASPIAQVICSTINFLIQLGALAVFFIGYMLTGTPLKIGPKMLLIIPIIFQIAVLALGIGLISSCLCAKYRDFRMVISLVLDLWMYATPVIYPVSVTGGWMNALLQLNPLTPLVSNFKWAILGSGEFIGAGWILSAVITFIVITIGVVGFQRVEKNFADTV